MDRSKVPKASIASNISDISNASTVPKIKITKSVNNVISPRNVPENIKKAAKNVSKKEVAAYNIIVESMIFSGKLLRQECSWPKSDHERRIIIAGIHINYPICNSCMWCSGSGSKNKELIPCVGCNLVFYCSAKCRNTDYEQHSKICCNFDAPFDVQKNPYMPSIQEM